jgi:KaiC/GvpD/RAD55 family RecA-like ATPase
MDIAKELSKNQTVLLLMSGLDYNKNILQILKKLKGNICYVTLNKTFDSLLENFKKSKINTDNIIFIDAISKTVKQTPDQSEGVYYISSPSALTEISISIDRFLRHGFDYLIFDSLTNLLVYESNAPVGKFVSSLINKIKGSKTKAIFYSLSGKEQDALINQVSMFVDNVIKI